MKKLGEFELDKIYCGDCKKLTKNIPDNSIDLIVTDPPYQLSSTSRARPDQTKEGSYGREVPFSRQQSRITKGFMGKEWDVLPSIEVWKESLRVLKSGAFAFIMTTPRQDSLSQILMDLTNAGFFMGFSSIYWTYASGFPKASNISKMVDKRKGTTPDQSREFAKYIKNRRLKLGLGLTEVDKFVCNGTTNYSWFEGRPAGQRLPREKEYQKIKKILKLDNRFDNFIGEAEREVIGHGKWHNPKARQNWTSSGIKEVIETAPASKQAKELDGSYGGFQPKPAVEVIIVAMKPLSEKTYIDQALKNKKGITWLDDGRIPYESDDRNIRVNPVKNAPKDNNFLGKIVGPDQDNPHSFSSKGRFPANLLVSDDVLNIKCSSHGGWQKKGTANQWIGGTKRDIFVKGDSGSFSRYFDLDSWAVSKGVKDTFPFLIVPKASKSEKNKGCEHLDKGEVKHYTKNRKCKKCGYQQVSGSPCKCENPEWEIIERPVMKGGNIHPTVKPIKLMSYLITLGSREEDIILDPFIGSGTTAIACKLLNRRYLGFEISKEYIEIANARLNAIKHVQDSML